MEKIKGLVGATYLVRNHSRGTRVLRDGLVEKSSRIVNDV